MTAPIRVVIAEDSPTVRHHLAAIIEEAPELTLVGAARDGEEALLLVQQLRPDVVSMDVLMPRVDGLEATRQIMIHQPTPVVVVTGLLDQDIDLSFQALQAGALAVVEKPPHRADPAFASKRRQLLNTLIAMSQVGLVRRWKGDAPFEPPTRRPTGRLRPHPEIVAIGASAGGPGALSQMLRDLKPDCSVPIVIVQHMPEEFIPGLVRWLDRTSALPVRLVEPAIPLEPGVVHLAGGGAHVVIERVDGLLRAMRVTERGPYRYQPSVDMLFESVARACGAAGIGLVLTGMGDDGAAGLLAMRAAGAITLAQDEASSTVFGMPGAAVARGAVERVLALSNLATTLSDLI